MCFITARKSGVWKWEMYWSLHFLFLGGRPDCCVLKCMTFVFVSLPRAAHCGLYRRIIIVVVRPSVILVFYLFIYLKGDDCRRSSSPLPPFFYLFMHRVFLIFSLFGYYAVLFCIFDAELDVEPFFSLFGCINIFLYAHLYFFLLNRSFHFWMTGWQLEPEQEEGKEQRR